MKPAPRAAPHGHDREATFRAVYEAVYPDLLRFVQRRTDADQAEDVVAEALLVVWRRLDDLPPSQDDARAWIFGIARHVLLNDVRSKQRRAALHVRLADVTDSPSDDAHVQGVVSRVDVALAWRRLSATHQEALALAVLDALDAPQAAAVLGISPVAFRLRLSRPRRALRAHLDSAAAQEQQGAHPQEDRGAHPPEPVSPQQSSPQGPPSCTTAERTTTP